jgi:choline dehydrogenase
VQHDLREAAKDADHALDAKAFACRVATNQQTLRANIRRAYHFIVCGSGSSGSVVARRLAEDPAVNVLLLEAGGSDDVPNIAEAALWPTNLGTERDWGFLAQPNPHLGGRVLAMGTGKVLGGGSSINVMVWSRGHKTDWDYFAAETREEGWSYASVLRLYRRIEDWHGAPDPEYRGRGGLVFVQPAPDPSPIAPAMVEGARSIGIPTFENQNGRMMEGAGGGAICDVRLRHGRRLSVFRSYVHPYMDRPNLTVLTGALVTRLTFEGRRASGVEVLVDGRLCRIAATQEIVLSLGAIHTPKLLMQSGIGDEQELRSLGIGLVQHLPGVGQNFQDHLLVASCMWESPELLPPRNNAGEATVFWKSDARVEAPDMQIAQIEFPFASPDLARFNPPSNAWGILPGIVRPKSCGRLRLAGPNPDDPIEIAANTLAHPADLEAAKHCVELCREIGNSAALRPFAKREVMPAGLRGAALERFVRDGAVSYHHQSCTAKMGCDPLSVVDSRLRVYGVEGLRIADASVMPRITTGNTMAPCVVIGERAAEILKAEHGIPSREMARTGYSRHLLQRSR